MTPDQGPTDETMKILAYRVGSLHDDVFEMKQSMKLLADAVTKLAWIEERQKQFTDAVERNFSMLDELAKRVAIIEVNYPALRKTTVWVDWTLRGLVATLALYAARKLGML